jgi:alpha-D-xyloside xylohydrolase
MAPSYVRTPRGVSLKMRDGNLEVEFVRPNAVHVRYRSWGASDRTKRVVKVLSGEVRFNVRETSGILELSTDQLTIEVEGETLSFLNGAGLLLMDSQRRVSESKVLGEITYQVEQVFKASGGEAFYGLGQHAGWQHATSFNYANRTVILSQGNTDVAIPFLVSTRGYGILWDNPSLGVFQSRGDELRWWFEAGDGVDYYFLYGPQLDRVISTYRSLTGDAPMLPKWAYGYWQSKERYRTQAELIEVVSEFRRRGIPLDVIVQDWMYWGKYGWNAFKFDESAYPDPASMVKEIHERKAKVLISIWPIFGQETEIFKVLKERGCILPGTNCLNVYREECGRLFWENIDRVFYNLGIDGWWLDASEPEVAHSFYSTLHDSQTGFGGGYLYLNAFPYMETKAVYEGQRSKSNKRVVILTRSAFVGQQANSAVTWSGDIWSDWATLAGQVPAGLNFCLSGIPYWATDIGGFFSDNPDTQAYREVFTRWFQWGTFCPVFRVHGTNFPKEPWRFGEEVERILTKFIRLRYRLLPYIYSLAWKVTSEGYTMMRALAMDFREDREVYNIEDQFMFGSAIMVSAVTRPRLKSREVYLPKGTWYDFWNGKTAEGRRYVEVETPLDRIPIHVRAGSLIPMGPVTQYASPLEDIELRIYPGGDGYFEIYEDDGETYDYERGNYALIPLTWNDKARELTLGEVRGSYRLGTLEFRPVLVSEGKGVGVEESKPDAVIRYEGREVKVRL